MARTGPDQAMLAEQLDWVLPSFDETTTHAQTLESEVQRLAVLKSYLLLDAPREEAFERITSLAARIFAVPIALITLIDLGREFMVGGYGSGARDVERKWAFCSRKSVCLVNWVVFQLHFNFISTAHCYNSLCSCLQTQSCPRARYWWFPTQL